MKKSIKYLLLPTCIWAFFSSFAIAVERQGINIVKLAHKKDVSVAPSSASTTLAIELAPNGSTGLHTNPGHSYGKVTKGNVMFKIGKAKFKPLAVGQTFSVPPNMPMEVWNKSPVPAKYIEILILEKIDFGVSSVK